MVGTEYQAEVPSGLCHYKDGEKGDYFFFVFIAQTPIFFNVAAHNVDIHSLRTK